MASSALRTAIGACATALCAAALTLAVPGGATAATAYPGPQHRQFSADQVHRFLAGFYGHRGPNRTQRSREVTPALRRAAAANHRYDLLLCARTAPHDVAVSRVVRTAGGRGRATITDTFADHRHTAFTAYVGLDASRPIRLTGVNCGSAVH